MQTQISVIIPIYNAEATIRNCVQSILRQADECVEILLVDDGSTDQSGNICDELAGFDDRIRVYHTQNQGQGVARNNAILEAIGEYLWFVDADDEITEGAIATFRSVIHIKEYDVICASYFRTDGKTKEWIGREYSTGEVQAQGLDPDAVNRYEKMKASSLFGYLWNKLIKREFLYQHRILLDDIRELIMEDTLFLLKIMVHQPSYYYIQEPVYVYQTNMASTTRTRVLGIASRSLKLMSRYEDYLLENNAFDEQKALYVLLLIRVFCWSLIRNIPYDGISYEALRETISTFLQRETIQNTFEHKESVKCLKTLPSRLQRFFYRFVFFLMRHRQYHLLGGCFLLFQPMMRVYLSKAVK